MGVSYFDAAKTGGFMNILYEVQQTFTDPAHIRPGCARLVEVN